VKRGPLIEEVQAGGTGGEATKKSLYPVERNQKKEVGCLKDESEKEKSPAKGIEE